MTSETPTGSTSALNESLNVSAVAAAQPAERRAPVLQEVRDLMGHQVPALRLGRASGTRRLEARRPEARYRFSQQTLGELVKLQREIVEKASAWVKPGGLLLYSTCSIEPRSRALRCR